MPWQQHVADVGLELNPDGSLVYPEVDLLVGRQEGKTELKFTIAVMRLTAMVASLGPQRVTYTMQDRKRARARLERDYAPRLRAAKGFKEIPSQSRAKPKGRTEWRLGMNSGVEHIQFGADSWLLIDTPSRTGGHGDTLDLGMIDEAFAHADNTVEVGMEPAMLTRQDAQLWVLSAAGDGKSKYLWRKVLRGRRVVESGADSGVAYFEWSAEDDDNPGDPEVWRRACPGLGFTVPEQRLEALWLKALEGGPAAIDDFRRSYLCMWPEIPVLDDEKQFQTVDADTWFGCQDRTANPTGQLEYALDVDTNAEDQEWCSIGCSDGTLLELVTPLDASSGTGWVVEKVAEKVDRIIVDPKGRAGKLIDKLERAGVTVVKATPEQFVQASQQIIDAIAAGEVVHLGQPQLDRAVAGVAKRDVGDGAYRLSRSLSVPDISPLIAVMLARWAARSLSSGEADFFTI